MKIFLLHYQSFLFNLTLLLLKHHLSLPSKLFLLLLFILLLLNSQPLPLNLFLLFTPCPLDFLFIHLLLSFLLISSFLFRFLLHIKLLFNATAFGTRAFLCNQFLLFSLSLLLHFQFPSVPLTNCFHLNLIFEHLLNLFLLFTSHFLKSLLLHFEDGDRFLVH